MSIANGYDCYHKITERRVSVMRVAEGGGEPTAFERAYPMVMVAMSGCDID
jgi:hypothetical protein